jgi:glycosyltransferase involved in cell wall biosynthesis
MNRIILTSFTSIDSPGGVPRWNRDFVKHFPKALHYSWSDLVNDTGGDIYIEEWSKAKILNQWLLHNKLVDHDDIVITDGFWGDGLFPDKTVSVAHGIWSHLTKDDVDSGKSPEFPVNNIMQVNYRRRHLAAGGRIVAVSDFIAEQLELQWGWKVEVINNAIDVDKFKPLSKRKDRVRPIIIHGVTTTNKGFDHIDAIKSLDADVWLLDEASERLSVPKYDALKEADVVVQPSAYEGNSYFVLETLASGVPIVVYNVGLMHEALKKGWNGMFGTILDRKLRSPQTTLKATESILKTIDGPNLMRQGARIFAEDYSIEKFGRQWEEFLVKEFGNVVLQSR